MPQQHQSYFNSPKRTDFSRSGSALLLTLLVVSLLLMLVLSFTVYVRVSLREVDNRQELRLARANAKVGLEIAVASLQKYAGSDQRITSNAALTGST